MDRDRATLIAVVVGSVVIVLLMAFHRLRRDRYPSRATTGAAGRGCAALTMGKKRRLAVDHHSPHLLV